MSEIVNWITDIVLWMCFGIKELAVVLISMVPIIELRGAIPVGVNNFELGHWESFFLAFLGSSLVCIPLLLLLPWVFKWPLLRRVKQVFSQKAEKISPKWKSFALFMIVAIPLPGTGVWTGSAVAVILGFKFWKAAGIIVAGNLVSGLAMLGLTALLGDYLDLLLLGLFIAFVLLLAVFLYKVFKQKDSKNEI